MCAAIFTDASYVVVPHFQELVSYRSGTPQCVHTHTEKDARPVTINHLLKCGCYFVHKERRYVRE